MNEEEHQRGSPFALRELKTIQMPSVGRGEAVQGPVRVHRGAVDRPPPPVDQRDASHFVEYFARVAKRVGSTSKY